MTGKPASAENRPPGQVEEIEFDELLSAEFEYIAGTSFQANEDRARVTTFYLVAVGSLVAAILTTQLESFNAQQIYGAFVVLFGMLSFAGLLTLLQLVRLREAWLESALAMNQIKDFYIKAVPQVDLKAALRWRSESLPAKYKPWSISFMLALQVSLLGGVTLGASVAFLTLALGGLLWPLALGIGAGGILVQMLVYWLLLRR